MWSLFRIELRELSIEDGWHRVVDVLAVVATNDAVGLVYQWQVFLEVERNAGLGFTCQALLDVNCKVCVPADAKVSVLGLGSAAAWLCWRYT
jgi:hypothetical protein